MNFPIKVKRHSSLVPDYRTFTEACFTSLGRAIIYRDAVQDGLNYISISVDDVLTTARAPDGKEVIYSQKTLDEYYSSGQV